MAVKITYYGHSCFLAEIRGNRILFDPFITGNPLAENVMLDEIQPAYILISHGHADHILDCEYIARKSGALVICSWEIHEWLNEKGITNTHPMNIGGCKEWGGIRIKCVEAVHSSGLPDGSYGGCAMGFIVSSGNDSFYYSGDTALTLNMKLIADYWKPNFCLLPIGGNFTMDAGDAAVAASFIKCNQIIGLHFDTFGYIQINHMETLKIFNKSGINIKLPTVGETWVQE